MNIDGPTRKPTVGLRFRRSWESLGCPIVSRFLFWRESGRVAALAK